MPKTIQITIDADWIDSLMEDNPDAEKVLDMLDRHQDVLYDYIDDAILDMVERNNQE